MYNTTIYLELVVKQCTNKEELVYIWSVCMFSGVYYWQVTVWKLKFGNDDVINHDVIIFKNSNFFKIIFIKVTTRLIIGFSIKYVFVRFYSRKLLKQHYFLQCALNKGVISGKGQVKSTQIWQEKLLVYL